MTRVSGGLTPIYDGGKPLVDTIPATAGNAADTDTVGTKKKRHVISIAVTLVADATVVNRYVVVQITDGTNVLFENISDAITASATETKYFEAGLDTTGGVYNGLPPKNLLGAGYTVVVSITNGVVGDSFSGFTSYSEVNV